MFAFRTLSPVLLTFVFAGDAFSQAAPPAPQWGPSWRSGSVPGNWDRPERMERDMLISTIATSGNGLAVEIRMWGDVADLRKDQQYELRYQMRLQHSGNRTRVLGNAAHPNGAAFLLDSRKFNGGKWYGLEGAVDISRRDLSGMTGLPETESEQTVFIRVEPHLYDVARAKYTTPEQTMAILLVATVGPNRAVRAVHSIGEWIALNGQYHTDKVVDALQTQLNDIDPFANYVANAVAAVLPNVSKEKKLKLIKAVPFQQTGTKLSWDFNEALRKLAQGDDAELKAAAQSKLATMWP